MLIQSEEVRRFESLLSDIEGKRLPPYLAVDALQAFFSENPHLLMLAQFDEHEQRILDKWERWAVNEVTAGPPPAYDEFYLIPQLRYRTPSGRWATLVAWPGASGFHALVFSFKLSQIVGDLRRLETGPDYEGPTIDVDYEALLEKWRSELTEDSITVPFDEFIASLQRQTTSPRIAASTLWSPRLWTPQEQLRRRRLVDDVLRPHLSRWALSGLSLEDLNPSEFEDLVAELLFEAGLKVHKVRESPQGGRDLIARGTLIPGEEPLEMAVEVKHRRVVDRPEVQLALYQNRAYPALVFVTSGRFTAGVFKEKLICENRHRLFLKDGVAVGDMVRAHFGIRGAERRLG